MKGPAGSGCSNPSCTDPNCRSGGGSVNPGEIVKKQFLILYGLFQGSIQCRNSVSEDAFGVSFATLLLGLVNDSLGTSILSSVLLTMARVQALGPFMPEFVDLRPQAQRRSDRFTGVPGNDESESSLGRLIHSALAELRAVGGTGRAYREVTRRMVSRRTETLTKALMFRGWGDSYDVGTYRTASALTHALRAACSRCKGADSERASRSCTGWGGFSSSNANTSGGSGGWGQQSRGVEETAEDIEKRCTAQVDDLRVLHTIRARGTARPDGCTQVINEREPDSGLDGCDLDCILDAAPSNLPQISDFSCDLRTLHASSSLSLANLGKIKMRHFSTAPLAAIATEQFVRVVPRAELGKPPVSAAMRFDVSAHPVARSKVAIDMKKRIASDVELFATAHNNGGEFRCSFIAADEIVQQRDARDAAVATLKLLVEQLTGQRNADAQYVREALPVAMQKAHGMPPPTQSDLRLQDESMEVALAPPAELPLAGAKRHLDTSCGASPLAGVKRHLDDSCDGSASSTAKLPTVIRQLTEATCTVCLTEPEPGELRTTFCQHYFCSECLDGYLQSTSLPVTCPLCRRQLETDESQNARELFALEQMSSQKMRASLSFLFSAIISTKAADDLRKTNPFLGEADCDAIFDLVVAIILHASRVGQINRCLSEARGLLKLLLKDSENGSEAAKAQAASAIALKAQTLAEQLLTARHYVAPDGSYDPRFLLFEFTHSNSRHTKPQTRAHAPRAHRMLERGRWQIWSCGRHRWSSSLNL
jgi:hypothetical protein